MDWARAKSIILFLLVAFNIYLLLSIFGTVRGQSVDESILRNTVKILESRGVELECSIPPSAGEAGIATPAYRMLLENFDGSSGAVVITGIDVVYRDSGGQIQAKAGSPGELSVWEVRFKDGPPRYFSTSDGTEIK